jgi:hypothetical protein
VAVAVAVAVAVVVSEGPGSGVVSGGLGSGVGSGVSAGMVFSTVFGSGLFSVLGAWVVSSAAVGPRSDVGGGSLFISDPTKKAASADSKNANPILIIHNRARPNLEALEATDHNPSHLFSPSTNVKVLVYLLTPPNARAKIHQRGNNTPRAIGRSADESPQERVGEPRAPEDGPTGPRGRTRGSVVRAQLSGKGSCGVA